MTLSLRYGYHHTSAAFSVFILVFVSKLFSASSVFIFVSVSELFSTSLAAVAAASSLALAMSRPSMCSFELP